MILRQTMDHGVMLSDVYGVSDYTNEVRIYLDSDYEVYAVEGRNEILVESEAFRQAELVPLKDIFLRFYEQYGHGKKKTITDVKLNYTILDDEETEIPVWLRAGRLPGMRKGRMSCGGQIKLQKTLKEM